MSTWILSIYALVEIKVLVEIKASVETRFFSSLLTNPLKTKAKKSRAILRGTLGSVKGGYFYRCYSFLSYYPVV